MKTEETPPAYEELVTAIVNAVPEINSRCSLCDIRGMCDHAIVARPITLEDVLRAFEEITRAFAVTHGGMIVEIGPSISKDSKMLNTIFHPRECKSNWDAKHWLLGKPLSEQSPETIDFLLSLLCPKK